MSRFLWNFNKAKWRTRTVDLIPACQSCPYAFICRGGCASRSSNAHSDYFREFCGEIREIFAFTASRLAGQEWEKRRAAAAAGEASMDACAGELTLSLAGPASRFTEAERAKIMETNSQKEMFDIVKGAAFFPEPE